MYFDGTFLCMGMYERSYTCIIYIYIRINLCPYMNERWCDLQFFMHVDGLPTLVGLQFFLHANQQVDHQGSLQIVAWICCKLDAFDPQSNR